MEHPIRHLKIHFPIVRPQTLGRWGQCLDEIDDATSEPFDGPTFLVTDHNDHSQRRFKPKGYKRIGGRGIDYIGLHLPPGWKKVSRLRKRPCSVAIIKKKRIHGSIDKHDYYGVQVRVIFADGYSRTFWVVQANLGRKVAAHIFVENVRRIKRAFPGPAILGFDEIDEADAPDEHTLLAAEFPNVANDLIVGWGTYSPVIYRGPRRFDVMRSRVRPACEGLAKYTPHRVLVESVARI